MNKQEQEFRTWLRLASVVERAFYRKCLDRISQAKREKRDRIEIQANTFEEAACAHRLLTHPRNGYRVSLVPAGESTGGAQFGSTPSSVIIILSKADVPSIGSDTTDRPTSTVRGMLDAKRDTAAKLRDEVEQALASAHPRVRQHYDQFHEQMRATGRHADSPDRSCQTVIYRSQNGALTRIEIALVRDLLERQGWDVRLATPLTPRPGRKPVVLVYYHHHRSA